MPARPTCAILLTAALASACGRDAVPVDAGAAPPCQGLLAGDLVISEIMANPAGDDAGKEWFEIYNATGGDRSLRGLLLAAAREDGSNEKTHVVGGAAPPALAAGAYLVLGDAADAERPPFEAYGYGDALGLLGNGAGRLALRCGGVEIDGVSYTSTSEGRSRELTGAIAPDALANDDAAKWCTSSASGTPGAANERCAGVSTPGMCDDGGTPRAAVAPAPGDLVIRELLADPHAVADAHGEWFEVEVERDVDLNGLQIGAAAGAPGTTLEAGACLHVVAGSSLVFAHDAHAATNGMLPRVDEVFGAPPLGNGAGGLTLSLGEVRIDAATWPSSRPGVALARDAQGVWCAATLAYGAGDLGTPGAANPACPAVVPDGMCQGDGDALRAIVPPRAGDLLVSEVLADPAAVADSAGEWVELVVTADVDLNGLELGVAPPVVKTRLGGPRCRRVAAGARVLLAHLDDPTQNGGLPAPVGLFDFALGNDASGFFVGAGGVVLDAVTWSGTTRGASTQLRPAACVTPAGVSYGAGDRGTPGAENVPCE